MIRRYWVVHLYRFDYLRIQGTSILFLRAEKLKSLVETFSDETADPFALRDRLLKDIERMLPDDIADNQAIGRFGADEILRKASADSEIRVLTHCNTGSLATAGYGTALGVIRSLHGTGRLTQAYCTETRPYNQGARLTAYELVFENIPSTLITDSMAAALMHENKIAAVVVGADRVVRNGEFCQL